MSSPTQRNGRSDVSAEGEPVSSRPSRARARRKRVRSVIQGIVGIALAVGLLGWGLPYFGKTSWGEIWRIVQTVPLSQAVFFQVLMLAGLYFYTFTFTGSLPGLTHGKALIVNLCGSSVSNLLPGGGAAGLAATYAILRSWGFTNRATSTSAIVTGVWNLLARIVLPVIAIVVLWWGNTGVSKALSDAAVAGTIMGLAIIGLVVAVIVSEKQAQLVGRGLDRVIGPLLRRRRGAGSGISVDALVTDLRTRIGEVVRTGWIAMTIGMAGFFGLYYVLFVLVLHATGVELHLGTLFAAFAIGRILTSVGVTPGGVGLTEAATAAALVSWGASAAEATAGVVLFSVFTHLMEVPLGGIGWLLWSTSKKQTAPPDGSEPDHAAYPH